MKILPQNPLVNHISQIQYITNYRGKNILGHCGLKTMFKTESAEALERDARAELLVDTIYE